MRTRTLTLAALLALPLVLGACSSSEEKPGEPGAATEGRLTFMHTDAVVRQFVGEVTSTRTEWLPNAAISPDDGMPLAYLGRVARSPKVRNSGLTGIVHDQLLDAFLRSGVLALLTQGEDVEAALPYQGENGQPAPNDTVYPTLLIQGKLFLAEDGRTQLELRLVDTVNDMKTLVRTVGP